MAVLAHLVYGVCGQSVECGVMPDIRILGHSTSSGKKKNRKENVYPKLIQVNCLYWRNY